MANPTAKQIATALAAIQKLHAQIEDWAIVDDNETAADELCRIVEGLADAAKSAEDLADALEIDL